MTRLEIHSMNTLCRTQFDKNKKKQNVVQGIEAGGTTGLQTLFAPALKTEP